MHIRLQLAYIIFPFFLVSCASKAPIISNSGHPIHWTSNEVSSIKTLNQEAVTMQNLDYSCGSAALATLMKYYFNDDVTEMTLLEEVKTLFSQKDFSVIEENGLSFKELEQIAAARGYQFASVQLQPTALAKLSGPILVYVEPNNYRHFAILRGTVNGRVYLADPSRGNISMPIEEFSQEWSGKSLILGKPGFGTPKQHGLSVHAHAAPDAFLLSSQNRLTSYDKHIISD